MGKKVMEQELKLMNVVLRAIYKIKERKNLEKEAEIIKKMDEELISI